MMVLAAPYEADGTAPRRRVIPLNNGIEFMLSADAGAALLLPGGGNAVMVVFELGVVVLVEVVRVVTTFAEVVVICVVTVGFCSVDEVVDVLEVTDTAAVAFVIGEEELASDMEVTVFDNTDETVAAGETAPMLGIARVVNTGLVAKTADCDMLTKLVDDDGAITMLKALLGHMHEHGTSPLQVLPA